MHGINTKKKQRVTVFAFRGNICTILILLNRHICSLNKQKELFDYLFITLLSKCNSHKPVNVCYFKLTV
jgi:hypothetical protein